MGLFARPGVIRAREGLSVARRPSQEASPEDVFLCWLIQLPDDVDVAAAALTEIARLDRAAPLPPGPSRLRELMLQAAEPRMRMRSRQSPVADRT